MSINEMKNGIDVYIVKRLWSLAKIKISMLILLTNTHTQTDTHKHIIQHIFCKLFCFNFWNFDFCCVENFCDNWIEQCMYTKKNNFITVCALEYVKQIIYSVTYSKV